MKMKNYNYKINMKLLAIFLLSLILVPVSIIIHEFGHIVAHIVLGFPFILHYADVTGLEGSCEKDIGVSNCIISSLAGPLTTLLLGGIMVFIFRKTKNIFFFVFGLTLAGRSFVSPVLGMADENLINLLLKLPPYSIYLLTLSISIFYSFILIKNLENDKIKIVFTTIIGSLVGAFLWLRLIGPLLLP